MEWCFDVVGVEIEWQGTGVEEKGIDKKTGKTLIEVSEKYYRPAEVEHLHGDPSLAKRVLGWKPKTYGRDLAKKMVEYDLENDDYGYDV